LRDYVNFLGYVPEHEISSYLELANMLISPLNNTIQDWARCPSKIYMYLPFNKPILTCEIGEAKEIFGDKGYYFDNSDPESLAKLMEETMDKINVRREIDIFQHTWSKRAEELHSWLTVTFV
jgi:glycosyltransferase involved in cell wall biosynthesis